MPYGMPTRTGSRSSSLPPYIANPNAPRPSAGPTNPSRPTTVNVQAGRDYANSQAAKGNPLYDMRGVLGYGAFENSYAGTLGVPPARPPGGGSGSGGGGGGGVKPLSQAAYAAMLAAINKRAPGANWTDFQTPAYQGMDIEAWDPSMFNQMRTSMNTGYENAGNQVREGTQYVNNALQQNWNNYGALRGLAAPVMGQQLGDMMPGVATGGAADEALMGVNSETAGANAAFQRFLAANELTQSQAQGSRMNESALANQFYLNQLAQQKLADQTGIGLQESMARQEWLRRQNERQYQDSVTGQEWARENALYNNQGQNETASNNAAAYQEYLSSTLGPLLELIMAGNQSGLPVGNVTR